MPWALATARRGIVEDTIHRESFTPQYACVHLLPSSLRRPCAAIPSLAEASIVVSFTAVTVRSPEGQPQGCCAMLLSSGQVLR